MASTYTDNNGIEKPGSGEQSGTWGDTTNTNFDIIDRAINGVGSISLSGTTHTLTTSDGAQSDGHYKVLYFTGSPTGTNTVTISPNDQDKIYFVHNDSGEDVILTQGTGGNVTVADGQTKIVYADGAGAAAEVTDFSSSIDMSSNTTSGVPAGTKQLFVQTSAPTGWTKDTTNYDDHAIRVVTGTASSGGTNAFSTLDATPSGTVSTSVTGTNTGTALTNAQLPNNWYHKPTTPAGSRVDNYANFNNNPYVVDWNDNRIQGGGNTHTHTWSGTATSTFTGSSNSLDIQYVDVIVATKD